MTPLAQHVLKQMALPAKRRTLNDRAGIFLMLRDEFHTFELSQVLVEVIELSTVFMKNNIPNIERSFLPSNQTWIEIKEASGRNGFFLKQNGDWISLYVLINTRSEFVADIAAKEQLLICADNDELPMMKWHGDTVLTDELRQALVWRAYAALAMINSPRAERKTHAPHKGLQRRLNVRFGPAGSFPLSAWTEITLRPFAPQYEDSHTDGLPSGRRHRRHHVRAHLRTRLGKTYLVGAHWRGDQALGKKNSRYVVKSESVNA